MTALARTLRAGAVALAASFSVIFANAVTVPTAAVAQAITAKDFVQKVGNDAIKDLTDKTIPDNERVKRMRTFLRTNFDEAQIAKFVLGTAWPRTSDQIGRAHV